jgi:ankyrin repeat protein
MSTSQDELSAGPQWSESELIAKLGGGPYELASSLYWPRSLAFMRHLGTVENFQHAVWGLAENVGIEDRDTSSTIESYLRCVPNGIADWVAQLKYEKLTSHKFSPLAKLLCNNRHSTAAMLMQAGLDPDFPCDASGRTALQASIMSVSFNVDGLTTLLEHGASAQGERDEGLCQSQAAVCKERPLFHIWKRILPSESKPMETKEQLFVHILSTNAGIHELDPAGNNIAHVLCTVGSSASISDIIAMKGHEAKALFVTARNSDGFMPIHIACSFGHAQLIPTLISLGARPNAQIDSAQVKHRDAYSCSDLGSSTCFYLALINGRSTSAAMTILKKIDAKSLVLCVHDSSGTTPLHWCVWHHIKSMKDTDEHVNLVHALITNGCSLEKRDHLGRLPIHLACAGGHHLLVPILAPTVALINDRLAMSSPLPINTNCSKISRLRASIKKAELVTLSDHSEVLKDTNGAEILIIASEKGSESVKLDNELSSDRVDGVTPLLLAVMSRDVRCVRNVLAAPGILKFQMSLEPKTTNFFVSPPLCPFATHFATVVNTISDAKSKIASDVLNRFTTFNRNDTSAVVWNAKKMDIHSPLSYAMVTAQFDVVDEILGAVSDNELIAFQELIQSKFRCKDDFFLLLVSSIVKAAKLSLLPQYIRNLVPILEDVISGQLESIPSFAVQDEEINVDTSDTTLDDIRVNQMISRLSSMENLPISSESMPSFECNHNSERSTLSCIHMISILGYSQCCESLMKANPLQNFSVKLPSGLISPLHICILYKRLACFKSLIKLTPLDALSRSIQEPLLNHLLPLHCAVLSGNLDIVIDLCSVFNSLDISNYNVVACQPAFKFQLLARAGSGYDLEITILQGNAKFHCVALNQNASESIYSNHLTIGFVEGPILPFLNQFEQNSSYAFSKLDNSCVDCLVVCSLYGLITHCRYLLSKSLPSTNKKLSGFFVDSFGSWVPMRVSLIRDWSRTIEVATWTPVNVAVHRGHREILSLLLSYGHDCNTRSPFGWTPLTFACFYCDVLLTDLLLKHMAIASRPDAAGWTPVMVCVVKLGPRRFRYSAQVTGEWSIEGARDRLSKNIAKGLTGQLDDGHERSKDVLQIFEQFQNLSNTATDSNTLIMNSLLERSEISSEYSPHGWSALYTAIFLQQLSVASTLIAAKANVNEGCKDGRKPLYAACSIPHTPLVLHLLKLKADPNPAVPRSRSKMMLQTVASKEGSMVTGTVLPQYHCLPIVAACKMGSMSVLLALLAACHSASKILDAEVVNAAASACIESISMQVLGMLLVHPVTRKHAASSISESFRDTCLLSLMLWAGDTCQLWAIRAALSFGADINGTKNGTTTLHIACSSVRSFKIAMYLVEQVLNELSFIITRTKLDMTNNRVQICFSETLFLEQLMR